MLLLATLSQQTWALGAVGAAKSALIPFADVMTALGAQVDRVTTMFGDAAALRAENQRLRAVDEQQRRQLLELNAMARENASLRQALDFERSSGYRMVAAQIVGRGPDGFSRTIVIDRGTAEGVRAGLVVVTGAGLFGHIAEAGPHSAVVRTLADPRSRVGVVLVNANLQGIVVAAADGLRVEVQNAAGVVVADGDWALTNGAGGTYPPGLVVGEVTHVTRLLWVNDPSKATFVFVITSFAPS
jgi:rod shape-determining protein MreC